MAGPAGARWAGGSQDSVSLVGTRARLEGGVARETVAKDLGSCGWERRSLEVAQEVACAAQGHRGALAGLLQTAPGKLNPQPSAGAPGASLRRIICPGGFAGPVARLGDLEAHLLPAGTAS